MWQPIETAPRDQTLILAYDAGKYVTFCVWWCDWDGWMEDNGNAVGYAFTHWQPLPAPPVE